MCNGWYYISGGCWWLIYVVLLQTFLSYPICVSPSQLSWVPQLFLVVASLCFLQECNCLLVSLSFALLNPIIWLVKPKLIWVNFPFLFKLVWIQSYPVSSRRFKDLGKTCSESIIPYRFHLSELHAWSFPKMGFPPVLIHFSIGFSMVFHDRKPPSILGYPPYHPIWINLVWFSILNQLLRYPHDHGTPPIFPLIWMIFWAINLHHDIGIS